MEKKADEESCRVKLANLPSFTSFLHVKRFIANHLGEIKFRKLKYSGTFAFLSLNTADDAKKAVELLDNAQFKKKTIRAKFAENEPIAPANARDTEIEANSTNNARELVTPLAHMDYPEQLERKFADSKKLLSILRKEMIKANIPRDRVPNDNILQKVLPSPVIEGYRNKCEFTVGYSNKQEDNENGNQPSPSEIVVGFISGKMANRQLKVLPVDDCPNISRNTKAIVKKFQQFVQQFSPELEPFDEFKRFGFWKMLTVRDFLGESMMIVTVYPNPDSDIPSKVKRALIETFMPSITQIPFDFNITSIYWQEQANASDERIYEHLSGPPFVYESLLGVRFRISPSTFFQTNSRAAAILYTKIGDFLDLPAISQSQQQTSFIAKRKNVEKPAERNLEDPEAEDDPQSSVKRPKLQEDEEMKEELDDSQQYLQDVKAVGLGICILDICCGAGAIGLCLMQRIRKAIQQGVHPKISFNCIGVELNEEAIKDARRNASENGFDKKSCNYMCNKAERIFDIMSNQAYHMPTGNDCTLGNTRILGVIDPPRAGVSDKVMHGCRKMLQLKTLVYVSCNPKSVMKNLVDLCRPISRKFDAEPFRIVAIQPVDMFPLTEHFEWIIKLER